MKGAIILACGIYKITNKITNKSYIGQSINIESRWSKEKSRAFQPNCEEYNKTLFKSFRKHGLENFTFEIIEECPMDQLDEKEQYYISLYDTYFQGYNETTGGQAGNFNTCYKISKEDLLVIYDLLQNSTISQKEIAKQFSVGEDVISTINNGKSRRLPNYNYPLRITRKEHICCDCGKKLKSFYSKRCPECEAIRQRKVNRVSREELKELIRNESFLSIGRKLGVSDNAIRRWCVYYNLPSKKSDIKLYSDDEWQLI